VECLAKLLDAKNIESSKSHIQYETSEFGEDCNQAERNLRLFLDSIINPLRKRTNSAKFLTDSAERSLLTQKVEQLRVSMNNTNWKRSSHGSTSDIECYKVINWHQTRTISVKTEWTIKVPFKKVFTMFKNPQSFFVIFKHEVILDVRDIVVKDVYREFRTEWGFPFPYNKRECYISQWEQTGIDRAVIVWDATSNVRKIEEGTPKGYVRAGIQVSGLVMEKDPNDVNVTNMKFSFQFDPSGSIPKWLGKKCISRFRSKLSAHYRIRRI